MFIDFIYILHHLSYLTVLAPLFCNALQVGENTQDYYIFFDDERY